MMKFQSHVEKKQQLGFLCGFGSASQPLQDHSFCMFLLLLPVGLSGHRFSKPQLLHAFPTRPETDMWCSGGPRGCFFTASLLASGDQPGDSLATRFAAFSVEDSLARRHHFPHWAAGAAAAGSMAAGHLRRFRCEWKTLFFVVDFS